MSRSGDKGSRAGKSSSHAKVANTDAGAKEGRRGQAQRNAYGEGSANAATLYNLNAGNKRDHDQGRNGNRRSLFMAGDLFKRGGASGSSDVGGKHDNSSRTSVATAHARTHTTPVVASGTFTPDMGRRLRDSDTASVRSTSSIRSSIAQRVRRVFSSSNLFERTRQSDGKKKANASEPVSRSETPDVSPDPRATQRRQGSRPSASPSPSSSSPQKQPSHGGRRSTGSSTPPITSANGSRSSNGASNAYNRDSFSSSTSSVNSALGWHGLVPPGPPGSSSRGRRRGSTSSSTSSVAGARSRRSVLSTLSNHTAGSCYSGSPNNSSTSLASMSGNTSAMMVGNTGNGNTGNAVYLREARSASFVANTRRPAAPSPLGNPNSHGRSMSYSSTAANSVGPYGANQMTASPQLPPMAVLANGRPMMAHPSMLPYTAPNARPPYASSSSAPSPLGVPSMPWMPAAGRPASPHFSPATASGNHPQQRQHAAAMAAAYSQGRPVPSFFHNQPSPGYPSKDMANAGQWERYRQRNTSDTTLRAMEAATAGQKTPPTPVLARSL
ncbi:hypothetical protein THASP1DRAFT_25301, partial [Thamnocephalis sphaerospora]